MEDTTQSTRVKAPASYSRFNPAACSSERDESTTVKPPCEPEVLDKSADRETIFSPKGITSIGTWNVRTLNTEESLDILERDLRRYNFALLESQKRID
jgi:hypothetical protein